MCENKCFQIGGPFIAEDPDCPVHGTAAQAAERRAEEEAAQETQEQKLARLKAVRNEAMRVAERAAYDYFKECDLGEERVKAGDIYENIRTAGRVY
jgi:hypothetical protein